MRTTAIITTVLLSASLVAGCGSSGDKAGDKASSGHKATDGKSSASTSSGDYCAQLKSAKSDFDAFKSDSPDFTKFDEAIARFHTLADSAPPEVAGDWKTVDDALAAMEKALASAGLSMKDIAAISSGKMPAGMTPAQLQAIGPKLQKAMSGLDTDAAQKAGDAIEKHAKSKCGVDLNE